MNEYWHNKVDAYLRNEMNEKDRILFENEMRRDNSLRQDVELSRQIIGRLKKRKEKLDVIKKWQTKKGKKRKVTYISIATIGIAASFLFGVFFMKPFLSSTHEDLIPMSPSFDIQDRTFSVEPMMISPDSIDSVDTLMIDSTEEVQGKHCTYTVGCNCSGFYPKTNGEEWEKSYCKKCGHHKRYHR